MQRINDDDLSMTDDYCYTYQDQPFTGVAEKIVYGKKIHEYTYLNGSISGLCRKWDFDDDYLKGEYFYQKNVWHGIQQEWYEFGQRKLFARYEHGICTHSVQWNQFGEISEVYTLRPTDANFRILQKFTLLDEGSDTEKDVRQISLEQEFFQLFDTIESDN